MKEAFTSKKLLAAWGAMITIAGVILSLALINSALLAQNKELLIIIVAAVAGLGGFAVQKQAELDARK